MVPPSGRVNVVIVLFRVAFTYNPYVGRLLSRTLDAFLVSATGFGGFGASYAVDGAVGGPASSTAAIDESTDFLNASKNSISPSVTSPSDFGSGVLSAAGVVAGFSGFTHDCVEPGNDDIEAMNESLGGPCILAIRIVLRRDILAFVLQPSQVLEYGFGFGVCEGSVL